MAPPANLTALAANAVTPVSGNTYLLENLKYSHYLNLAHSDPADNIQILSWSKSNTTNELWRYLAYPSDSGESIFTLEAIPTLQSSHVVDGRGGYMRVDTDTNKLVQGGAPMAWKLVEVATGVYQMTPFDDIISKNGTLMVTDTHPTVVGGQMQLPILVDDQDLDQFWVFQEN